MSIKKADQSKVTREALVRAGRELFGERGFAGTSTTEIVERAGVTRGALYHQFRDKEDLFRAVYEEVERDLTERVMASLAASSDPLEQLRLGASAFLDACLEPAVRRIALLDAPTVLGWERKREIDLAYGLGLVRAGLEGAMQAGALERSPVEALAHVLLGGLNEAAMLLAHATDPTAARAEVGEAVLGLLNALSLQAPTRRPRGAREASS